MKKIINIFCSLALAWGISLTPAVAAEVEVSLPTFPVTLNGVLMEQGQNEYPCLVYKDITYVAMTYYDARLLGLVSTWQEETGLVIKKADFIADQSTLQGEYVPYFQEEVNNSVYKATLPEFAIQVNGTVIENSSEEYPLLIFRDVTYFPLTWRFAHTEFGWQYNFDSENGLVVTPVPTPVVTQAPTISTAPTVTRYLKTNTDLVNLRQGPGTNYEKVGQMAHAGTYLTYLGTQNDWFNVRTADGKEAWVASWLVDWEIVTQGPVTSVAMDSVIPMADKTQIILSHGQNNKVRINSATATLLDITLSNTTVGNILSDSSFAVGPLQSMQVINNGNNEVRLVLNLKPGSYCNLLDDAGRLTVNIYARQEDNAYGLNGKVIMLDPGHGGADVGAIGSFIGVTDEEVGRVVSLKLKDLLEAQGANVIMTRSAKETGVELYSRPAFANAVEPDLFISIHADSIKPNTVPYGAKIFYYAGDDYLSLKAQKYIRQELATAVQEGIAATTLRKASVATNNYVVLRENNHPSILVECGFLSNPEDEALLATDEYRQKLAEGIYAGILNYFTMYP